MKPTLLFLLYLAGCANTSYVLDERKNECEGSTLSAMDQIRMIPEAGRVQGIICFSRAVTMKNGEPIYRGVCDFGAKGMHPIYKSFSDTQETCELGAEAVKEDFFVGLAPDERPFVRTAQRQEEHIWIINPRDRTCTVYPMSAEMFVLSMQKATNDQCSIKRETIREQSLSTVVCGDNKTGKAWLLTDNETTCQNAIQAQENSL